MDKQLFSIIGLKAVTDCIDNQYQNVYHTVEEAYKLYDKSEAISSNSHFLKFPENLNNRIIALPAAINDKISGIKWIASYPKNIEKNQPRASAVIILNDYETGFPIACLEASYISAVRTVLSAILFLEQLLPDKTISRLGIIGTGNIALNFCKALKLLTWKINKLTLFDNHLYRAENFIKSMNEHMNDVEINVVPKEELLGNNDVVLLATTATEPHIHEAKDIHSNAILLNISLRDLSPDIILSANNFVDDIDHVLSANTSPHLTFNKVGNKDFINGTLADLMNKRKTASLSQINIFSPMGLGILDIAVAYYVYQKLQHSDHCHKVTEFYN